MMKQFLESRSHNGFLGSMQYRLKKKVRGSSEKKFYNLNQNQTELLKLDWTVLTIQTILMNWLFDPTLTLSWYKKTEELDLNLNPLAVLFSIDIVVSVKRFVLLSLLNVTMSIKDKTKNISSFQNYDHFQYNISWNQNKVSWCIIENIIILKELRIASVPKMNGL